MSLKNIVGIYAQRLDDGEIWEEIELCSDESNYSDNTIAVVESGGNLSYDFSNCGELTTMALDNFFRTIGVMMGVMGLWSVGYGQQHPSKN